MEAVKERRCSEPVVAGRGEGDLFAQLFDSSPDGIFVVGGEGRIMLANGRLEELLGYRPGALIGASLQDLVPEDVRGRHDRHRCAYQSAPYRRTMGADLELNARRFDGSAVPVEIALSPLTLDGETVTLATVRDDTERRAARRTGAARVAETGGVAEISALFVTQGDLDEKITRSLGLLVEALGAAAAEYYIYEPPNHVRVAGLAGDPELNKATSDLSQSRRAVPRIVRSAVADRQPVVMNRYGMGPRRRTRLARAGAMSVAAAPVMTPGGPVGCVSVTSREIDFFDDSKTNMLVALAGVIGGFVQQAALRSTAESNAEQLAAIFQISRILSQPGAVENHASAALDVMLRVLGADRALLRMADDEGALVPVGTAATTAGRAEWSKERVLRLGSEESTLPVRAFRSGKIVRRARMFQSSVSGSSLALPVHTEAGIVGTVTLGSFQRGFFSARKEEMAESIAASLGAMVLAARLREDLAEQRTVVKQRDAFVATASHELRTPLSALVGFSELLLYTNPPEEIRREWYEAINSESLRLSRIVGDLLDVSKLQSGALDIHLEPVPVEEIVNHVVANLGREVEGHRVQIESDATDGVELPRVIADRDKLSQVLMNLVHNAAKYSALGSTIVVRMSALSGDAVRLAVQDEGLGIPSEALTTIFEPFYRVRSEEMSTIRGTGLGLFIAKGLVESMRGTLRVESTLGTGSTFTVTLQAADQSVTRSKRAA